MKWYTGPENSSQHDGFAQHLALRLYTEGGADRHGLICKSLADFISKDFAEAFEIATKTKAVALYIYIAHFGQVLAHKRRMLCKIVDFHCIIF